MRTARTAARIACPEVRDFLFASAEYVADIHRFRARQQSLSGRRHDWDDIQRHMRAAGRLQARAHELEALRLALEAKLKQSGVAL
jgi:predicted deacylase